MIYRRHVLQRPEPYDFIAALIEIQKNTLWGVSDLVFVLNVSRGCIRGLLAGARPDDDLGQAIRVLRASCASYATPRAIGLLKAPTEGETVA